MSKDDKMLNDDELDALFASTQKQDEVPSADFMGRLLGDAAAVSASWAKTEATTQRPDPVRFGFFALLSDAVGGWRGGMTIASAMLLGIYVGLIDPVGVDTVSGLVASLSGVEVADEATLYDLFLEG